MPRAWGPNPLWSYCLQGCPFAYIVISKFADWDTMPGNSMKYQQAKTKVDSQTPMRPPSQIFCGRAPPQCWCRRHNALPKLPLRCHSLSLRDTTDKVWQVRRSCHCLQPSQQRLRSEHQPVVAPWSSTSEMPRRNWSKHPLPTAQPAGLFLNTQVAS